jgi:hypothetical protein
MALMSRMAEGRLVLGLLVAALCLAGCGSGNTAHADDAPNGLAPDDAVARVLASLGDPMVQGAEVVDDPSDLECRYPCLRVRVNGNPDRGVKAAWLATLVEGAVGELIRTDETSLSQVLAAEAVGRATNGKTQTLLLGTGESPVGQHFNSPSDAALRERVATVADEYGLEVVSVEVLHPLDSALAVTFTVPPGPVSWTMYQLSNDLMGTPVDEEGLFIELDSPSGEPLLRSATHERIKGGGGWSAPGQDERFGVEHG